MLKTISLSVILILGTSAAVCLAEQTDNDAAAAVERLHATLLSAMTQAETLGYGGRYELLNPVIAELFDFSTIARIVTGRHWKDLAEEQKNAFTALFARLSTATYATNFSGFSGERFETLGAEERRGHMMVKAALVKGDGERVKLDYLLHKQDGAWRIVNVIAQGVSDLSLKRADYTAVLQSKGFDSLVAKLTGKIAAFESKTN